MTKRQFPFPNTVQTVLRRSYSRRLNPLTTRTSNTQRVVGAPRAGALSYTSPFGDDLDRSLKSSIPHSLALSRAMWGWTVPY